MDNFKDKPTASLDDRASGEMPMQNTDRELWRESPDDYYANSIHVTEGGGIGINVGGRVYVKTLAQWHALCGEPIPSPSATPLKIEWGLRSKLDGSCRGPMGEAEAREWAETFPNAYIQVFRQYSNWTDAVTGAPGEATQLDEYTVTRRWLKKLQMASGEGDDEMVESMLHHALNNSGPRIPDPVELAEQQVGRTEVPTFCGKRLELPACAAIRYGSITLAGKRHHDCLAIAANLKLPRQAVDAVNHGFMTTYGRFVNRVDARLLMERAKLDSADPGGYRGDELYSEDLY